MGEVGLELYEKHVVVQVFVTLSKDKVMDGWEFLASEGGIAKISEEYRRNRRTRVRLTFGQA